MTKKALIDAIVGGSLLSTRGEAEKAVDAVVDGIRSVVERGDSVQIAKFGTFAIKERKGRIGRNPSTGETITIAPKKALVFKDKRG